MSSKRYEEDTLIFTGVDSNGKVFYRKKVPARRYWHARTGIVEWKTKGRGTLELAVYAFKDMTLKGVFVTTPNLDRATPGLERLVDPSSKNLKLKKFAGLHLKYRTKTIMTLS